MAAMLLLGSASSVVLSGPGCARDPVMVAWESDWKRVERAYGQGDYVKALGGFRRLQRTAVKPVDAEQMQRREADALWRLGRLEEAEALYERVADDSRKKEDRGRARLQIASMKEDAGHEAIAQAMYRRLVMVYPNSMAGLRALHHLERRAGVSPAALLEHLRWTWAVYRPLRHTRLADNLIYFAAREAYRRFLEGEEAMGPRAEELLRMVIDDHERSGLWDSSVWLLSFYLHRTGRYTEEIRLLVHGRVKRPPSGSIFGSSESDFAWRGRLRIAQLYMTKLGRPADAVGLYQWFLEHMKFSILRDDVRFYLACAHLRAGAPDKAEDAFAAIPGEYAESKFLRRVAAARAEPDAAVCDPPQASEPSW